MRARAWSHGIAGIGLAWVIGATFLHWSVRQLEFGGAPRRIYTYTPHALPRTSLWQYSPVLAIVLITLALIAAALPFLALRRTAFALAAASIALILTALIWLHAPGPGIGEPLTIVGSLELIAVCTLMLLIEDGSTTL
jgi:hypothetical protein